MQLLKKVLIAPMILMVRLYQWLISPLFPPSCRYTPTCSAYMVEALQIWGPFKGTYLGLKRIGDAVLKEDRPEIRGMLARVPHLVSVVEN